MIGLWEKLIEQNKTLNIGLRTDLETNTFLQNKIKQNKA